MGKGLKGITVKIDGDATGINQALSGTNATARSLSGELKGVNSLLKFDPSNTELLAQKQELLKQSITNTEEKLKVLKQAQEEAAEAGKGINDEGYRDLQREIAATQQKLQGLQAQQENTGTSAGNTLQKTNASLTGLQKELQTVDKLLQSDAGNTELLAQKQEILKQSITNTEEKIKLLKQAQEEAAEAGKDINDEGYRNLQREITVAQKSLKEYSTQLKSTEAQQKKAAAEAEKLGQKIYKIASHIPIVNKLADGFVKAKQKIAETVKESAAVKKISSAVERARQKVEAFKNAHPHVKKVADAFHSAKEKAGELKEKLPQVQKALKQVGDAAAGAVKGGFKALGSAVGGMVTSFAAFSASALAAGAAVLKSAVEQYASYEQLIGGVETLFGAGGQSLEEYAASAGKTTQEAQKEYNDLLKAQETVIKNANNAYKTAGLSANEYMETVTGFSAALIQSLDGDTVAAAEKANMAITDMSDNANKMGTSMESIQTAYQGFAKQNYTMLDNLKLGYGGTKEEMERLLADATQLSGVEYDISSYADIVDAIHVVQNEMGITGTTAKEASSTIEGSVNAAKSAWGNLVTGLADENADLDELINNMANSVITVVNNVLPRVMETVPRIVEAVPKLIDGLSAAFSGLAGQLGGITDQLLPPLMQAFFTLIKTVTSALPTMLPQVLNAAITLFSGLLQGLQGIIPNLLAMLPTLIKTISQTLIANLPQLVTSGVQILTSLISGITQTIPTLITEIIGLIPLIVQAIMENLPFIVEAGLNLLLSLVSGIAQAIPQLVEMLPTIIDTIVSNLVAMFPTILDTGTQLLDSLITGIVQAIPKLVAALPQVIVSAVNTIIRNLPKIIQAGIELIGSLISGIIRAIPTLLAALPQVFSAIINAFKEIDWLDLGKNLIDGVINGIKNAASSLINVFKDLAKQALDAIKNFFGIHSPSSVMRDEVGKMLPAGMADGVEEGMDEEEKRIQESMKRGVPTTIDGYIKSGRGRAGGEAVEAQAGGFVQNLTINSPRELNPSETARLNRKATQQMILKIKPA